MGEENKPTFYKDYTPGARLCSRTASTELGFTNFLHSMAGLTGFKEIIDSHVTTDHYQALDKKKSEMAAKIEGMRWAAIKVIMEAQTSAKSFEDDDSSQSLTTSGIDVSEGVDEESIEYLKDIIFFIDKSEQLFKTRVQDKLNLFNFSAIANTLFLYIICFVLLTFVKWN
tara:strand:+ start:5177 stop:5686 length:510 start_codon:yes stop_codon:yes gene_type:complete